MSSHTIKIAILAMGGEGGGVLADWIVELGEQNGCYAQTTSVPGVAQRTGATIYYFELYPREQATRDKGEPVLALMPLPGDVDIVLASELMEVGRAVQRGLVTPDRTTLIGSTHRVYSIAEKMAMGDGRVVDAELIAHAAKAAKRFVRFDMQAAAERSGSVLSAVLFGALSAAGVLPFPRAAFEATIERGGVGVKPSLRAFAHAYEQMADRPAASAVDQAPTSAPETNHRPRDPDVAALLDRVRSFPLPAQHLVTEGVRRLIDYQDPAYATLYLDRLTRLTGVPGDAGARLVAEAARHLALWMSYEDTIRVADLKTRKTRFERVGQEVNTQTGQQLGITEFMHPRLEEICETLPVAWGRWLMRPHLAHRAVQRFTREGRFVQTSSLGGYLMLYGISRLRRWRRGTLRYAMETTRIEQWLAQVNAAAALDPELALEIVQCQRLVKGYGDTHARGLRNYETLMRALNQARLRMAPATLRELRDAALADEHGKQLQAGLARHGLA
ncbi:indolepyruvate oxidoreductase subunit beta family protein [soil metagenome]